jgi:hypothetical protein
MPTMSSETLTGRLTKGAIAGLASTAALQGLMALDAAMIDDSRPPMDNPAEFMTRKAEHALPRSTRARIPAAVEAASAAAFAFGYGGTAGAIYAAIRPGAGKLVRDGAILGAATWGVGYLGWLPALGLMKPVSRQEPREVIIPLVEHVLFGVATVAIYRGLTKTWRGA